MYFKENKYLAKVNHIIYKSNIEYTLSESEINDLKEEGDILIKQFTDGEIDFLFNYGVLTTGFDAPKTRNIVICRPINSTILYEQIIGRGIRGSRFGGTEECDVIDFSDNIHNLGKQQAYMRFKEFWDSENEE